MFGTRTLSEIKAILEEAARNPAQKKNSRKSREALAEFDALLERIKSEVSKMRRKRKVTKRPSKSAAQLTDRGSEEHGKGKRAATAGLEPVPKKSRKRLPVD
jgi:hypothetical protein